MISDEISADQVAAITEFVDIEAPPPEGRPSAYIIFGTNQPAPAEIAAREYHSGSAPLIIATGGINRHNGINEAREFRAILASRDVPDSAIRIEDRSANTWQNVEFSLSFLHEALDSGLTITAVCKWYHRRAVHILKTLMPSIGPIHVITWEPIYAGRAVTRTDWPLIPDGKRRVIREWEEVSRRVSDGSFKEAHLTGGAWCLRSPGPCWGVCGPQERRQGPGSPLFCPVPCSALWVALRVAQGGSSVRPRLSRLRA